MAFVLLASEQLNRDANVTGWRSVLIGLAFIGAGAAILWRRQAVARLLRRQQVWLWGENRATALGGAPGSAQERRGVFFIGGFICVFGLLCVGFALFD